MRLRILAKCAAGLGIAALVTSAGAWADKPESFAYSYDNEQIPFFDCSYFGMDFWILADWTYNEYGRIHYDKDANIVKINGFFFNTDRRAYNSNDPSKAIEDGVNMVGAPEHQHFVVRFDEGVDVYYKESGISFKAVVPGYGNIVLNAGTVVYERIGDDWVPIKFTPNRGGPIEDWYPICAVLQ
jgi:hypothetical protein